MKEFAVEKLKAPVTLHLEGGAARSGALFVAADGDEPTVNQLRSLLDGPDRFLPFETDAGQRIVINKDQVLWCRHDGPVGPVIEVLFERRRMTLLLTDGTSLSGDVVADGPADRRRVVDCLNRARGFLLLETSDGDCLIRQSAIATVPSSELGEPRELDVAAFEIEEPARLAV